MIPLIEQLKLYSKSQYSTARMKVSKTFIAFAFFILLINSALIYIPNVSINPLLVYQVQVACDRLETELRANYGTTLQNNTILYAKVYLANYFLTQLNFDPAISNYSNVIFGANNSVNGSKNIIIGDNGNIVGNYNYVFSQNFTTSTVGTSISNSLVLDEWLVRLYLMYNIPFGTNGIINKWK